MYRIPLYMVQQRENTMISKEQMEKERHMQKPKRNLDTPGLKVENASKLP